MAGGRAVEAGARELAALDRGWPEWDQMVDEEREVYREQARSCLTATAGSSAGRAWLLGLALSRGELHAVELALDGELAELGSTGERGDPYGLTLETVAQRVEAALLSHDRGTEEAGERHGD